MSTALESRASHGFINRNKRDVTPYVHRLVWRASRDPRQIGLLGSISSCTPHPQLAPLLGELSACPADSINEILAALGTTTIRINKQLVFFDGGVRELSFVTATGADALQISDNMSGRLWVRDQAFIAEALLEQGDIKANPVTLQQGKELLLSLLYCMSTPSQLRRFDNVVKKGGKVRPEDHPSIMYELKPETKGLILDHKTIWGHNQDAWQILASLALKAYDKQWISADEIRQYSDFFTRIPGFLEATNYLERSSKGSWEEINAKGRLSTIAWEWSLLIRILQHSDLFNIDLNRQKDIRLMIAKGAAAILNRFPDEAAHFHRVNDPSHRKEDAALLYIGLAQVPELLAQLKNLGLEPVDFSQNPHIAKYINEGLDPVDAMYVAMFETVDRLKDPLTGGYARYFGDSYQASLFWLPTCWQALTRKRGLWNNPIYRDSLGLIHFKGRERLLDEVNSSVHGKGYGDNIARWMHPNTQAATIAFRRAYQTSDPNMRNWYTKRGLRDMGDALRMITGEGANTLMPVNGKIEIQLMPAGVAPECYVTNVLPDGKKVIHPGPWGPLLWAAAGLQEMLAHWELAQETLGTTR